jgi:hypothetical protein
MLFQPGHPMAAESPFTAYLNMERLFTQFLLSAARSKSCTRASLGPWAIGLDWSPDGKVLAFSEGPQDKNRAWITLLSLADSAIHPLTSPSNQEYDSSGSRLMGGEIRWSLLNISDLV